MEDVKLKRLLREYVNDTISDEELNEFFEIVAKPESMRLLRKYAKELDISGSGSFELPDEIASDILSNILSPEKHLQSDELFLLLHEKRKKRKRKLFKAVGAVGCFLLICAFFFFKENTGRRTVAYNGHNQVIKDALPGQSGAVLTLSNGRTYLLDTMNNGRLVPGINKSSDGISVLKNDEIYYAILETPNGRTQKLVLSDGTRVWLNAGSSIRFPSIFKANERRVEITGEAYFEVEHNDKQPFIVMAGNDAIRDLGTHFDVKAYCDETSVTTTLLEGSVQVGGYTLQPGQQYADGNIKSVDTDGTIAWLSGFFHFEDADIKTVMRQLGRWYNVQVKYEGDMPAQKFEGEIQRSLNLSQALGLIAGTGIHYTLDGDLLTIHP